MIYVAGSLFTSSEIKQRRFEGSLLKTHLKSKGLTDNQAEDMIFNPVDQPHNDKSTLPKAVEIYENDFIAISHSNRFIFNFDNPLDAGVFMEFGQVVQRLEQDENIKIVVVMTDMRIETAGEYDGYHVPYGFNQYVIGAIDKFDIPVYNNIYEAVEYIVSE